MAVKSSGQGEDFDRAPDLIAEIFLSTAARNFAMEPPAVPRMAESHRRPTDRARLCATDLFDALIEVVAIDQVQSNSLSLCKDRPVELR